MQDGQTYDTLFYHLYYKIIVIFTEIVILVMVLKRAANKPVSMLPYKMSEYPSECAIAVQAGEHFSGYLNK